MIHAYQVYNYCPSQGGIEKVPCPAGTFAATLSSTGHHAADEGSVTCDACMPGTFASNQGMISCDSCPPGHHCPGPGATNKLPCEAGWFAEGPASVSCDLCPNGLHSDEAATYCYEVGCPEYWDQEKFPRYVECLRSGKSFEYLTSTKYHLDLKVRSQNS